MATALINGVNYSWKNAKIILFGVPLIGITSIELTSKQNKENNYGFGVDPVSRGYGNKEYSGKLTVYYDELANIIDAAPNRDILDIAPFNLPMLLEGGRIGVRTITAKMVEFTEHGFKSSQGESKVMVDLPLIVAGIDW